MRARYLKSSLLPAVAMILSSGIVHAEAPSGKDSDTSAGKLSGKTLEKVTCEEFNGLDETFKPKVIAWAAGYKQGQKKPDAVAIDIAGTEKVTPFVVEECRKTPSASLWSKIDQELKKIF
ncbi:acid-resistance protein [Methylobacterium sp. Leaf123]|uniref:acid-activated periplasmic chaperone HdeA n=1 Tax=Methylobacterium sp. Leaf123 TaxID=1736264 RepID=UPI0006FA495C|nr:acid-activated periplasmic chaperone HdeA [Methylobacterium sp. Leaf123]KQQ14217.1 acid-resistance protein [Methylobacterium sp. Leaf123]